MGDRTIGIGLARLAPEPRRRFAVAAAMTRWGPGPPDGWQRLRGGLRQHSRRPDASDGRGQSLRAAGSNVGTPRVPAAPEEPSRLGGSRPRTVIKKYLNGARREQSLGVALDGALKAFPEFIHVRLTARNVADLRFAAANPPRTGKVGPRPVARRRRAMAVLSWPIVGRGLSRTRWQVGQCVRLTQRLPDPGPYPAPRGLDAGQTSECFISRQLYRRRHEFRDSTTRDGRGPTVSTSARS